jgi:hypothetical protein
MEQLIITSAETGLTTYSAQFDIVNLMKKEETVDPMKISSLLYALYKVSNSSKGTSSAGELDQSADILEISQVFTF